MFQPTNEQGTIFVFSTQAEQAGWKVIEIGGYFPDATLEYRGELWKVEFEYKSSNFIFHGHDPRECDLIICWENDYKDCPLPIIELRNSDWSTLPLEKCQPYEKEIEYWRQRCFRSEKSIKYVKESVVEQEEIERSTYPKHRRKRAKKIRMPRTLNMESPTKYDKRRFDFLRMLAETTKKSEVNFTEVARQFGTSDTTMRKDLDWLIKNEYWLNGNDWKPTAKGLAVVGEPLSN